MEVISKILLSILDRLLKRAPLVGKIISSIFGALEFPILEFMRRLDDHFHINLTRYVNKHILKGKWGGRVVPLNRNIEVGTRFTPIQEIKEIVGRSSVTKVSYCYCRTVQRANGNPNCDHPLFTCIHLGSGKYLNELLSKDKTFNKVSKEKVLELLKECDERGLIHQLIYFPSPEFYYVICNCCPCCCVVLDRFLKEGTPKVIESDFIAYITDDVCQNCGICTKWCYFDALTLENDLLKFNPDQCFGCGICVSKCPNDAISLQLRKKIQ